MPVISSDTLFHFTSTQANLLGILVDEFRPRLSVESFRHLLQHLPHGHEMPESGIPMVCFCDIPLSQVADHMDKYGDYGIGLKKAWGIANGITPVMYTHERSPAAQSAATAVRLLAQLYEGSASASLKSLAMGVGQIVYLLKPYQGVLKRPGRPEREVRFYDEREWRYLPAELESIPAISPEALSDPKAGRVALDMVERLPPLSFDPNDINYVIVRHDSELLPMYHALRAIKEKYDDPTKDLLVTRLISAERIRADF